MQHQLAISPLCQITRYTQILSLSLTLSLSLSLSSSFTLPFLPLFLTPSLPLPLTSFSLAQRKSYFACDFFPQLGDEK